LIKNNTKICLFFKHEKRKKRASFLKLKQYKLKNNKNHKIAREREKIAYERENVQKKFVMLSETKQKSRLSC
jgi:hypothetical protein